MLISSQLQALLTQFQSRYAMGCLCSELLTIHQEQYVVRAIVQSGSTTLATAIAAGSNVEAAEDRAKVRALEALGLTLESNLAESTIAPAAIPTAVPPLGLDTKQPLQMEPKLPQSIGRFDQTASTDTSIAPSIEPTPLVWKEITKPEPAASVSTEQPVASAPRFNSVQDSVQESVQEPASFSSHSLDTDITESAAHFSDFDLELPSQSRSVISPPVAVSPVPEAAPVEKSRPAKSEKSKRKTEPFELPPVPTSTPPRDLSDRSEEIMKIGIEMKRLGWSTEQGREYLKRTYGKRSRQELDEAELLDFLRYLEAQPSPLQTPF